MLQNNNLEYINNKYSSIATRFGEESTNRLIYLYETINQPLQKVFSLVHFQLNKLFKYVNSRISNGRITAQESRDLIFLIEELFNLQANLSTTVYNFNIHENYLSVLNSLNNFLEDSYGSDIPKDFTKINILENIPIFTLKNYVQKSSHSQNQLYELKLIGEGSYAKVFKYKDTFYNKTFVIKRAKNGLSSKELKRFETEFNTMQSFNSPYIIEVYKYDSLKNEYYMEYADYTLEKFINQNNNKLTFSKRCGLVNQIIRAFEYIHSKNLLHRDISPNNILLKAYEELHVVKISDFGLVKLPDNSLTSRNTEFKGSFNDPNLELTGFGNYELRHEIFALSRIIYFVMEGRITLQKFFNDDFESFIKKGTDLNINNRFKTLEELKLAFEKCIKSVISI
ncbi:protein kinase family protein [Lysinibacillus sp. A4]|uniref:protein kinase family protein n=1 Tax=unclassified Lysinibacillus TaxID=2636778 RepID=UPI002175B0A5|nr:MULTISPECIES: protein kinase family protein [unclassified Lysinibacillus]MCS5503520.1 protein kinase family protein [Lysinibacillus sp. A4]WGT39266.1 protein kinase family protein [Lysinibacillus sp. 1 U-2021]